MKRFTVCVFLFALAVSATADPWLTFLTQEGVGSVSDLHLYLLDVGAGGKPIDITPPDADGGSPVWSPGSRILFSSMRDGDPDFIDLYTVDRNGKDLEKVTNTPNRWEDDPAWSPNGRQIAYCVGNPNKERSVWVLDLNTNVERELVPIGGEFLIKHTRLAWSPDGRQIAFNAFSGGAWGVYVVHTDAKQPDLLHKGLWFTKVQDWLSTGELLVLDGEDKKLGLLPPNGEFEILFPEIQEKLRISSARSPWRRPDLFVFSATPVDSSTAVDVYRVKRNGTGLRQLTSDGEAVQEFSPDLWYDALDVLPAEKLTTTWGEVKADEVR